MRVRSQGPNPALDQHNTLVNIEVYFPNDLHTDGEPADLCTTKVVAALKYIR